MRSPGSLRLFLLICAIWLALSLISPVPALAQCVMCRANLGAAGLRGMRTLNRGIVVLIVPTVGIMAGIGLLVYRRRD